MGLAQAWVCQDRVSSRLPGNSGDDGEASVLPELSMISWLSPRVFTGAGPA